MCNILHIGSISKGLMTGFYHRTQRRLISHCSHFHQILRTLFFWFFFNLYSGKKFSYSWLVLPCDLNPVICDQSSAFRNGHGNSSLVKFAGSTFKFLMELDRPCTCIYCN